MADEQRERRSPSELSSKQQKKANLFHPWPKTISDAYTRARVCSLGANLPAVWLRCTQLRLLIRQGVLADWQRNADWDDAVYRVAAIIPMNGFQLDQEAFVQHLHYKAAA